MTKGQSVLIKIMRIFASEKMLLQRSVLSYRIDLYFPKHRLAIEVHEKGYAERNECENTERKNAIIEHLDCKFISISPDENDFDVDIEIDKMYNHTENSSKNFLIDKISKKSYQN